MRYSWAASAAAEEVNKLTLLKINKLTYPHQGPGAGGTNDGGVVDAAAAQAFGGRARHQLAVHLQWKRQYYTLNYDPFLESQLASRN